jgi:hypothetical protein
MKALAAIAMRKDRATPVITAAIAGVLVTMVVGIGNILLWRRQISEYTLGPDILSQASRLFAGLIVFVFLQPLLTTTPFTVGDIVTILVLCQVCAILVSSTAHR